MKFQSNLLTILSVAFVLCFMISCKDSGTADTTADSTNARKETAPPVEMLEPAAFEKGMNDFGAVLLDVRMPQEFEQGHIEGAKNINFFDPNFKEDLLKLNKNKTYYMYCKNDSRSETAANYMKRRDFADVYVLNGGYEAWKAAGK